MSKQLTKPQLVAQLEALRHNYEVLDAEYQRNLATLADVIDERNKLVATKTTDAAFREYRAALEAARPQQCSDYRKALAAAREMAMRSGRCVRVGS